MFLSGFQGSALLQLGRYPEAILVSEQQLELFEGMDLPDVDGAPEARAKATAELGATLAYGLALDGSQLSRALELAESAVEANPSEAVLGTVGAVLVQVGREREGIEILKETLLIAPTALDKFETHRFLALGHRALGEVEAAIDHCQRALAIRPDFSLRVDSILVDLLARDLESS